VCGSFRLYCPSFIFQSTVLNAIGVHIANTVRKELKEEISSIKKESGLVPTLGVVLVGNSTASKRYVSKKRQACVKVGINVMDCQLSEKSNEADVQAIIQMFNNNPKVHAILVQLPLPPSMNERKILDTIRIDKDVDGLHSASLAALSGSMQNPDHEEWKGADKLKFFVPCTPLACLELLDRSGVSVEGKRVVVIGRSMLVGMPLALLLTRRNATVTIVHKKSKDIQKVVQEADILFSAVGKAHMVQKDWLKPGVVVVDIGTNYILNPKAEIGFDLVGDVKFDDAVEVASLITPVPGGVGPMTISMLLWNTVKACKQHMTKKKKLAVVSTKTSAC